MNLIIGETGHKRSKFSKQLGNKTFQYTGKDESVVFLEEILFNLILKEKESNDQSLVVTFIDEEKVVLSFFNDAQTGNDGEASIEYLIKDFTGDKIKSFIKVFIKSKDIKPENTHYVNKKLDNLSLYDMDNNLIKEVNISEIEHVEFISGFKKNKSTYFSIILLIGVISGSIYGNNALEKYISESKLSLEREIRQTAINANELEREIKSSSVKYESFLKKDGNLFSDKSKYIKLKDSILALNLPKS